MNCKTIKLLSKILLISVFAVGASVTVRSQTDKLADPSPVKTNALSLINELKKPSACSPDETLCLAESLQSKLEAAIAGLQSIVRVDEQREGVIADMQKRIDVRGGIIDDLQKIDRNSQRIDIIGQANLEVMREQHRDDKEMIGDLQQSLESCRSNQKWIFGAGAITGGLVGYKIRGAGQIQNPFQFNSSASAVQNDFLRFNYSQTRTEEMMRRVLKGVQ